MARDIKAGVEITGKDSSSGAFASLISNIDKSEAKFKRFNDRLAPVGAGLKTVGGLALGAGSAIAGGVVALVAGAVEVAQGAQQEVDSLNDLHAATGLSVQTLSELAFANQLSGVAAGEAEGAYKKFARSIGEVHIAGSKTYKALAAIDPALAKQLRGTKDNNAAFELYMSKLASIDDVSKRTRLANILFGKSALFVNKIMRDGTGGYEALRKEAAKYGVVTDDMVDKADAYGDAQDRMNIAIAGLKRTVGIELMPALTEATEGIADFIAVNREDIGQGVAVLAKNLGEGIINLGNWIKENPDSIKNFISDAADAAATLVAGIKDVKTNWDDLSRLFGGSASRQDEALTRADAQIIDVIPTPAEVASGSMDPTRLTGRNDEFMGEKGGFNAVTGRGAMGALFLPTGRFGMGGGLAAGLTTITQPDRKIEIKMTVPKGMVPASKPITPDGVSVQIVEDPLDDMQGHSWQ